MPTMRVPRNHCRTCRCVDEVEYNPSPAVEVGDVVRERSSGQVGVVVRLTMSGPVVEGSDDCRWYVGPYDLVTRRIG